MDPADQIRKFRTIVENVSIVESYEDRVRKVADAVVRKSEVVPLNKTELLDAIGRIAIDNRISDYTVSASAKRDFVKDVLEAIKGKVRIKKVSKSTGNAASPNLSKRLTHLRNAIKMIDKSFENIPDGLEPIDHIMTNHRKYGFTEDRYGSSEEADYGTWMNVAAVAYDAGHAHGGTDDELKKYVTTRAIKAAVDAGAYSNLEEKLVSAFKQDYPELARDLGYRD